MVVCPNCGAENPETAYYCGRCAVELRPVSRPPEPPRDAYLSRTMRSSREPDAMVSVAINVRRIFILIGTTLVITAWSTFYSFFFFELAGSWLNRFAYGAVALIIAAIGLWYAITKKRVTTL